MLSADHVPFSSPWAHPVPIVLFLPPSLSSVLCLAPAGSRVCDPWKLVFVFLPLCAPGTLSVSSSPALGPSVPQKLSQALWFTTSLACDTVSSFLAWKMLIACSDIHQVSNAITHPGAAQGDRPKVAMTGSLLNRTRGGRGST